MTLGEALRGTAECLKNSGIECSRFEAEQIVMSVCGYSLSQLMLSTNDEISAKEEEKITDAAKKRSEHYPLQYILGEWEFYSLPFTVNEGVLIPRPDTEILVDTALDYIEGGENLEIADLCSGSGCIAVAVAKNVPDCHVTAIEKYEEAYNCLVQNIKNNKAEVKAINADIFEGTAEHYDIILSNPPYIKAGEISNLQPEVGFEPQTALNGGTDGLDFYRAIAEKWVPFLIPGGAVIVEIGYDQREAVTSIFKNCGLKDVKCIKDYADNDRVIIGTLPI